MEMAQAATGAETPPPIPLTVRVAAAPCLAVQVVVAAPCLAAALVAASARHPIAQPAVVA